MLKGFFVRLDPAGQVRREMMVKGFGQIALVQESRPLQGVGVG